MSLPSSVLRSTSEDGGDMFLHDVGLSLNCNVLKLESDIRICIWELLHGGYLSDTEVHFGPFFN